MPSVRSVWEASAAVKVKVSPAVVPCGTSVTRASGRRYSELAGT